MDPKKLAGQALALALALALSVGVGVERWRGPGREREPSAPTRREGRGGKPGRASSACWHVAIRLAARLSTFSLSSSAVCLSEMSGPVRRRPEIDARYLYRSSQAGRGSSPGGGGVGNKPWRFKRQVCESRMQTTETRRILPSASSFFFFFVQLGGVAA